MYLLGERIVGNTFTSSSQHYTLSKFPPIAMYLINRKKWCEMLGNNTKYSITNHCTPDKVVVAENAHIPQNKDPCSYMWSCDYNVGKNDRKELISLVFLLLFQGNHQLAESGSSHSTICCLRAKSISTLLHRLEALVPSAHSEYSFCSNLSTDLK